MKRFFIAGAVALAFSTTAQAADSVKIGILMGFTGPIESLTVGIANGAKLALQEVSDSKRLLSGYPGGIKLEAVDAFSGPTGDQQASILVHHDPVELVFRQLGHEALTALASSCPEQLS